MQQRNGWRVSVYATGLKPIGEKSDNGAKRSHEHDKITGLAGHTVGHRWAGANKYALKNGWATLKALRRQRAA